MRKPRPASRRKTETVPLDTERLEAATESADRNNVSDAAPLQDAALGAARSLAMEDAPGADGPQGPYSASREGGQQVHTPVSATDSVPKGIERDVPSTLAQTGEALEVQVGLGQEPAQLQTMASEVREDRENSASIRLEDTVQQAPRAGRKRFADWEPINPIYILVGITLGIPTLLLIALVGLNPGVQEGALTTIVTFLVISAFVTAAIFEIKRLADQPSDDEHH